MCHPLSLLLGSKASTRQLFSAHLSVSPKSCNRLSDYPKNRIPGKRRDSYGIVNGRAQSMVEEKCTVYTLWNEESLSASTPKLDSPHFCPSFRLKARERETSASFALTVKTYTGPSTLLRAHVVSGSNNRHATHVTNLGLSKSVVYPKEAVYAAREQESALLSFHIRTYEVSVCARHTHEI